MRRCNNMGCLLKPIIGLIKWVLMIIGLLTVIVAIIIGIAFWQLGMTPAMEAEMRPIVLTEAEIQQYADSFDTKVENLAKQLEDLAVGDPVTITFTEKEASAKILKAIEDAAIPLEVTDIWVNFDKDDETGEDVVRVLGKVDAVIRTLTAGLEIEMSVENNEPKMTVSEVAMGSGFLMPGVLKDQLANAIPTDKALTDMLKGLPISVSSVQMVEGEMTFSGTKKHY